MTKPIILFHANCLDGTGAKYAAWKKFGEEAEYIPVQYNQPIPESVDTGTGREIYILDFSYPRETLLRLREQHSRVSIIDHHKTSQEALVGLSDCVFDMEHSGAVLAWKYFHPDTPVPFFLELIEDGDLWKFTNTLTKPFRAVIPLLEANMEQWDGLRNLPTLLQYTNSGEMILKLIAQRVKSAIRDSKAIPFQGHSALIVNSTGLASEIGEAMYDSPGCDIGIIYFVQGNGDVIFSLRSDSKRPSEEQVDVAKIAEFFGGGGHKNASGFKGKLKFLERVLNGKA